ncbi:kielin/chordin-like protein [Mytilus edulis]|uniref:kielin/chordin-like protein n=1 Tax=Mytilus edulis TaxID=6550 RepID=UPI0039EE1C80
MKYHILDTASVHKEFGNMIAILVLMLVSLNCVHATCNYHGTIHQIGTSFPDIDGCNTCNCEVNGISCTEKACLNPSGCKYDGIYYNIGDSFPSIDRCNTCTCGANGSVGCTEKACSYRPKEFGNMLKIFVLILVSLYCVHGKSHCSYQHHHYDIGATWPTLDGCNTCSCTLNGVHCTANPCPTDISKRECHLNQNTYKVGATWTASDGCNLCSCTDTGVHCTNHHCQVAATCTYQGIIHHLGSRFDATDGCNTCMCMEHGVACTEMACIKPSAGTCNYHRIVYNVGDSFNSTDGCNTCHCTSHGVSCTEMFCGVLHPTVQQAKYVRSSVYQIGFNCNYNGKQFNVGESWPATDGCNTCSCHSGKLVVRMACTDNMCDRVGNCAYNGKSYNMGESFPDIDKCNTCTCGSDGSVSCTEMACLFNVDQQHLINLRKRSSVYQTGFHCHHEGNQFSVGESWTAKDGCNTCTCHAGNILVRRTCTEKTCAVVGNCAYNGQSYKMGESFQSIDKCNTCTCGSDGSVSCTEMACLSNVDQHLLINLGKRSSVYQRGFHCRYEEKQFNVGETWTASDGCNSCSCHAGDLIVRMTCTEKTCAVGGQCTYHGKAYKVGESFPSIDKCNTCACDADGSVPCTERFCLLNENQAG